MVKSFKKKNVFVFVFAFTITIIAIVALHNQLRGRPAVEGESTYDSGDITVSATIGTITNMTIFGYAPASSHVFLSGDGITEDRFADSYGYFVFGNIKSNGSTSQYPELCLIAYINNLSTQPTCLPSLPGGSHIYEIGPVILSPIIAIEKNSFTLGSQVALNGCTTPDSGVKIYLSNSEKVVALVPKALAYAMPAYEVTSDKFGKFQFNLPSNTIAKWKVFAATTYNSSASPKSNILNFTVQSNISYFLKTVYETIVKTTTVITTAVTAKTEDNIISENSKSIKDIPVDQVNIVRDKMPYYVMFIEGFVLLLLILFILNKRKKKKSS